MNREKKVKLFTGMEFEFEFDGLKAEIGE